MEYVIIEQNDGTTVDVEKKPSVIKLIKRVIKHDDYIFSSTWW
jgi:hypothetical protein